MLRYSHTSLNLTLSLQILSYHALGPKFNLPKNFYDLLQYMYLGILSCSNEKLQIETLGLVITQV